jgi:hypothetical protein
VSSLFQLIWKTLYCITAKEGDTKRYVTLRYVTYFFYVLHYLLFRRRPNVAWRFDSIQFDFHSIHSFPHTRYIWSSQHGDLFFFFWYLFLVYKKQRRKQRVTRSEREREREWNSRGKNKKQKEARINQK